MSQVTANNIKIEYQISGQENDSTLLIIPGLGMQMNQGMTDLIPALVDAGFQVITFDNRDTGLSSKHEDWGPADIKTAFTQARSGETVSAPYNLEDMADDAVGLLDALNIPKAHILGSSNGGAIAQIMTLNHPHKILSLTCVMATSGRRGLPRPTEAAANWLASPRNPEGTAQGAADEAVEKAKIIGSHVYPRSESAIRDEAIYYHNRSFYPDGNGRQLLASIASGDQRVSQLGNISVPTLVLHGKDDPLIPYPCGEDIKNSIHGSQLKIYEGMAHEYSVELVPDIANTIWKFSTRV